MVLSKLLEKVTVTKLFQTLYGRMVVTHDVEVGAIAYDSRRVRQGDLFVAVRGADADGHRFAHDAITMGAKVVVVEDDSAVEDAFCMHAGAVKVVVPDSRKALAAIASAYYGRPGDRMTLIGITGTNGKTTTASLVHGLLMRRRGTAGDAGITGGADKTGSSGSSGTTGTTGTTGLTGGTDTAGSAGMVGLIGTIEYKIGEQTFPSTHTTPGPVELNGLLSKMLDAGCGSAVMEVSSHALDQRRVDGLRFNVAVFTNLTRDHLDYHATMQAYFDAKATLFTGLGSGASAVINIGDEWGRKLASVSGGKVMTYGFGEGADLRAADVRLSTGGTAFTLEYGSERAAVETQLVGTFNVENILAAAGTGLALGIPFDALAAEIAAFRPVRGRFEPIRAPGGWTVIVDYAHTPDALEKTLTAIRAAFVAGPENRIITVFGCGGNRDRKKRPEMGRIAASLGDVTIVTSDNPREEDPEAIIDEIIKGIEPGREYRREADRATAIGMAAAMAKRGDIVLIAGKGHEEYQVVGKEKRPFSDRDAALAAIGDAK